VPEEARLPDEVLVALGHILDILLALLATERFWRHRPVENGGGRY